MLHSHCTSQASTTATARERDLTPGTAPTHRQKGRVMTQFVQQDRLQGYVTAALFTYSSHSVVSSWSTRGLGGLKELDDITSSLLPREQLIRHRAHVKIIPTWHVGCSRYQSRSASSTTPLEEYSILSGEVYWLYLDILMKLGMEVGAPRGVWDMHFQLPTRPFL